MPGGHGGADGEVPGQTPGRLQENLPQRGRREIRRVLQTQQLALPGDCSF